MNTVSKHNTESGSWEATVSCWVDGESELRTEELDSPYGRSVWDTYNLIGDVMRSSDLAIKPSDRFYARVSAAIDAEPAIVAPVTLGRHKLSRLVLPSLAVVAVASMVWVAQPLFMNSILAPAPSIESTTVLAKAEEPILPDENKGLTADPRLADYMAAHQAMAGAGPMRQVSYDLMGGGH